ncbi:MAG: SLC13 family permease [Clostridium sp.]
MNMGLLILLLLFAVVAVGFWRKINVGFLSIAVAVAFGYGTGLYSAKDIIGGFSASLFMTLLGVTLFFGLVQSNGCIELVMKKLVRLFGRQIWIIPILMYAVGFSLAAIGPGCVPALAFVAAVAIPLAHQTGYNPIMLMIIGDMGSYSGRFSPITPEGVLITQLLKEQGITANMFPIIMNALVGTIVLSVIVFAVYKGYRVKPAEHVESKEKLGDPEKFGWKQILALVSIAAMIFIVIVWNMDVGLASFLAAAVLALTGAGDEKTAIKNVPWGTLMMVCGVGVLMKMVIGTGGIDVLASAMASIMTSGTAPGIIGVTAAVMSWFSSAIGVVFPTLIPTVSAIVSQVGGNTSAMALTSTIAIFASVAGLSPASTAGAIIMGAYEADPIYGKEKSTNQLFLEMIKWAVACIAVLAVLAFVGVFGIIR